MEKTRILITGANGQIGQVLTEKLREQYGNESIIPSDIKEPEKPWANFEQIDVLDRNRLEEIVIERKINRIYHLAAILSAKGEQQPRLAWNVNMRGLLNVLEVARELKLDRVFFPSSIAVFGKNVTKDQTPQESSLIPESVYGISKVAGELWCNYYYEKHGVDVRSIRYPGIIGHQSEPGGGTTDYAVSIFHEAIQKGRFTCFLKPDTALPMMFMDDAIRATIELMEATPESIQIRSSYNLGGISFTPAQLAREIKHLIPGFTIDYEPDFRQEIADSWPSSIDDSDAQKDWDWNHQYDLKDMVKEMITALSTRYETDSESINI